MSIYEDYDVYPDGSIKDPDGAVKDGNLEQLSNGCYYNKWTRKEYWPDGTPKD